MPEIITDREIDAYLDGELSDERAQQIEELARRDPELAAKITVIGYFSGVIADRFISVDNQSAATSQEPPAPKATLSTSEARGITIILLGKPSIGRAATSHRGTDASDHVNSWDLLAPDGKSIIRLPAEIAVHCYSKTSQDIKLTLWRAPLGDQFEPQLELTPPPNRHALICVLRFCDGKQRKLEVLVPRRPRKSALSSAADPLPADSFGNDQWQIPVTFEVGDGDTE